MFHSLCGIKVTVSSLPARVWANVAAAVPVDENENAPDFTPVWLAIKMTVAPLWNASHPANEAAPISNAACFAVPAVSETLVAVPSSVMVAVSAPPAPVVIVSV